MWEMILVDWLNYDFRPARGLLYIKAKLQVVNGKKVYMTTFSEYKKIARDCTLCYTCDGIPIMFS